MPPKTKIVPTTKKFLFFTDRASALPNNSIRGVSWYALEGACKEHLCYSTVLHLFTQTHCKLLEVPYVPLTQNPDANFGQLLNANLG